MSHAEKADVQARAIWRIIEIHVQVVSHPRQANAATRLGATEIAETCRMIQEDEREMAAFLEQQLPTIVQQAMARETQHRA